MTLNALPKGLAELETMVKGGEPGEPGGSALGALDALVKGGGEGGGEGGGGKSPEKKLPEIASSLAERATKEAMEAAAKHGSGVQVNDPFHRKAMIEAHRHAEAAHRNAAKVHTRQGNAEAAAEHTRQEKAHGGMAKDHEEGLRRAEKEAAEKEKADQEARDAAERPARYKSALEMADKAGKAAIDATAAFVQTGEEESVEKRDQLAAGHRKAEPAHRLAAHETSDLHTREQHHKEADYHKTVALHHDKWARKNEKTRAAYEKHAAAASQAGDDYQRAVDRGDPAHVLGKMARKAAKHHQDSAIAAEPFGNPKIEGAHDKYRMHYQKLADGHEGEANKSLPALSALSELTKSKPIPLPTSGKAASIASMRAAQGVDSEGNAKKGGEIPGGLAEGKKPADFPAEALAAGTKVEMEHTKDPRVAEEIAMDHLTEDSSYYTKLARMESGKKPAAAAAKPKSKADRALLKLLEKNPNPKDAKVHALAAKLGMPVDKLEERAYALLADAQKEKSMGTQEMKKGALAALATLTGSDPLEKSMGEDSLYSRDLLSRYGVEAEKKKAEKREKVEAASKGLPLEDYRLTPGVDCTHQPHLAVAHAQAVLDSRVRALRDQGVQVGRPGPAPTSRMQKGEDGQIVRLGQSTVLTGGQSDQQAARLADAGRLGAPAESIPIDRAAGTQVVACPACQGALLKALTVCPHCGVDQQAPRAPREAPATRPALAARDGQPRLRPAVAETVTLADLQGRGNG